MYIACLPIHIHLLRTVFTIEAMRPEPPVFWNSKYAFMYLSVCQKTSVLCVNIIYMYLLCGVQGA